MQYRASVQLADSRIRRFMHVESHLGLRISIFAAKKAAGATSSRERGSFLHQDAPLTGDALQPDQFGGTAPLRACGRGEHGAASPPMTLEKLNGALVLFGLFARCECAEIAAFAGPFVNLARIDPILAIFQLPDHFLASAISGRTLFAVHPWPAPIRACASRTIPFPPG